MNDYRTVVVQRVPATIDGAKPGYSFVQEMVIDYNDLLR